MQVLPGWLDGIDGFLIFAVFRGSMSIFLKTAFLLFSKLVLANQEVQI